jgi:hypothetical protein
MIRARSRSRGRSAPRPHPDERKLAELDKLATLLDSQWRIPGTRLRFGVDAAVGLIPGLGDLAAASVAGYLILRAKRMGVPNHVIARMVSNVAFDTVFGSVPLLGSVFDVFFKANKRNMRLLRNHFEMQR